MQHVFQSTFLQALGFAIANSLWQMALVWLIYMCVNSLVSFTAAAKYRLAVAAQFIGFVWFMVTLQFYYSQYSEALQHSAVVSTGVQNILSANTDLSSRVIQYMLKTEQFLPYISMAYLLLILFLSIRWLFGYRQTQLIRQKGLQKIPADWRLFVKRIATQLGIKKEIRLFLSENITTPLTVGFFKPVILIPVASINHLTTDQLEAVLLHELAHIKRYDYLLNIILSVIELTLFFNPFTQLLSKQIREERENSCDDWVLQFKYNATVYAEALLRIAYMQSAPAFAMAASGKKKNDLLIRVKRMIGEKENRFSYRKQLLALLIVTGMLSSIAWLNPVASPHKQTLTVTNKRLPVNKQQTYAVEPMAVSVDNPLFNPMFFLSKPLKAEMKRSIESAQKEMELARKEIKEGSADMIASIPSMVANVIEQTAASLSDKKQVEWEKEMNNLEMAKTNWDKAFHTDSVLNTLPQKMRAPLAKDISTAMKEASEEINKAKKEMETRFKEKKFVFADQEKVEKEIKNAIDEAKRIGLDKLVMSALNIPALLFTEDNNQTQKIRISAAPVFQKVPENPRKIKRNSSKTETEAAPTDQQKTETDIDFDSPAAAPELPVYNEREKTRMDAEKLLRLKQWLLKEASRRQVKVIPVAYTIDGEKDIKLVIVLQ